MNRTAHLIESAQKLAKLDFHDEHIILDYGSNDPIKREQLPSDSRIKLHRVENSTQKWWLTHSYNLAFSLAKGNYILKLDADIVLEQSFVDELVDKIKFEQPHLMCNRLTIQEWSLPSDLFTTNGLFLCQRASLEKLGGFNPYLQGWGWDEIDLYSRFFLAGLTVSRIPKEGVQPIEHDDELREPSLPIRHDQTPPFLNAICMRLDPARRMKAQNEKNRLIAVASIVKLIEWPNFSAYRATFSSSSNLPGINKLILFNALEKQQLVNYLIDVLLQPTWYEKLYWRLLKKLGKGPYSDIGTNSILSTCNINLSLIT